jgi:hypothetical protein
VVEDARTRNGKVRAALEASGLKHSYLNAGPSRDYGNIQKDLALRYIRDTGLKGVVYIADDDNYYDPKLFREIRKTERVSVFPVGNHGPGGVERPIVKNGKITGWNADWKSRKFPVDMAGFAFDAEVLRSLEAPLWRYKGRGGETEFLESFVRSQDELECLCSGCTKCYVWHNQPLRSIPSGGLKARTALAMSSGRCAPKKKTRRSEPLRAGKTGGRR